MALAASAAAVAEPPFELSDVSAGTGGFIMNGIYALDYSGRSVSGAGDVNGDGLGDLIVGAPGRAAPSGLNYDTGASYVVFGKADTTAVDLADIEAGTPLGFGGFVIRAFGGGHSVGACVSSAGDFNGDGLADVLVGSFYIGAGRCYVVFGKADIDPVYVVGGDLGSFGFAINGIDPFDNSGASVSGAGDVNGDGYADLIVGAPGADPDHWESAGESYVVFGRAGTEAIALSDVAAGLGGFAIIGIHMWNPTGGSAFDQSGFSVAGAGDVNGDGLADLIVGAPGTDERDTSNVGKCYVVFGKADTGAVELADVTAGVGGFSIAGIDAGDTSGAAVSGAGDVNGDGLADVIIGAADADPGGNSLAGESYVVFGKADTAGVELSDVAAGLGGFVINGIDAGDDSGRSVSGAGDVNGDGLADLLVGAHGADAGGATDVGESYVVFGKSTTGPMELADVAAGLGGFVINGIDAGDDSGRSVSGAGDVNGDGLGDLIVGAPGAAPQRDIASGESYVLFTLCRGDFDLSGNVGFADLTQILLSWGPCPPSCPWDLDGTGDVGFGDLTQMLLNWGSCSFSRTGRS